MMETVVSANETILHKSLKLRSKSDTAWKDILEVYLKDFFDFCLPELSELIDWNRGWTSLDQELHKILKNNLTGNRIVDKLIKVFLKTGEAQWILIHIEIQGKKDDFFEERMFTIAYRGYDKFRQALFSCAILTDGNQNWRPNSFYTGFGDTGIYFKYKAIKLLDFQVHKVELENSPNPFAMVVLVQLAALEAKNKSSSERFNVKYALTKQLYKKGYNKGKIQKLLLFIDWLFCLTPEFEIKYSNEVMKLEETQKMAYIHSAERIGYARGMLKGIADGKLEGKIEGKLEGEILLLRSLLEYKFGKLDRVDEERLNHATPEQLLLWARKILEAKKIEEVFV